MPCLCKIVGIKGQRQSMFSAHSLRNKHELIVSEQNQIWRGEFTVESCMKVGLKGWRHKIATQTQKGAVKVKGGTLNSFKKAIAKLVPLILATVILWTWQPPTAPWPPQHRTANPSETLCAHGWPSASPSLSNMAVLPYIPHLKKPLSRTGPASGRG